MPADVFSVDNGMFCWRHSESQSHPLRVRRCLDGVSAAQRKSIRVAMVDMAVKAANLLRLAYYSALLRALEENVRSCVANFAVFSLSLTLSFCGLSLRCPFNHRRRGATSAVSTTSDR